mgnify:CR=1 FL=1
MNRKRPLQIVALVLAVVLVWLLLYWEPSKTAATPPGQHSALASAPKGGDFTLVGGNGPVALADYRGKVVVLYFGYTYCPDVCPTSLSRIAQGFSELDAAELRKVQGILISVDPERDTPLRLADYAPFFHPSLIGVTGTAEQISAVAGQYGASYRKHPQDADGHYSVDHTSLTYIIGPDGKLMTSLPYDSTPHQIIASIRPLLASTMNQ